MNLLVSAFIGPADPPQTRGGLFKWNGVQFTVIDEKSTAGLCLHKGHLVRGLRHQDREQTPSTLMIYRGRSSVSVDLANVASLHDVCSTPEGLAVVATNQNKVVWVDEDGYQLRQWQPNEAPDSWHLNSLIWTGDRLLASAFGRQNTPEAWKKHWQDRQGVVVDVATNEVVLKNLTTPHSPRQLPEGWLICESRLGIVRLGKQKVDLKGWTRGLAVSQRHIYVGVSAHFFPMIGKTNINVLPLLDRAYIAVLDRESLQKVDEILLPERVRHVYDLLLVEDEVI